MAALTRWLAPVALSAALGAAALAPAPAKAQSTDDLIRVLVDVADVAMRGNTPYYRYGDYGYDDRLTVNYDRYGRPMYYRYVPRNAPRGNAYGYYRNTQQNAYQRTRCDARGRCRVEYYDPRYDRRGGYGYDGRDPRWGRD